MAAGRIRSLFLSSWFRGMHAERGHLRKYVIPEQAEFLRTDEP